MEAKQSLGPQTVLYPTPVLIVGTYDAEGKPNIMNAAWGGVCCSQPPCLAVALRAATYSHGNIVRNRAFTISIPSVHYAAQADYAGMCSGRDTDKFADAGLTPVRSELVHAPYVGEFPLVFECRLAHTFELGLHTQFVGEIVDAKADASVLDEQGRIDVGLLKPFMFAPATQTYHAIGGVVGKAFSMGKEARKG